MVVRGGGREMEEEKIIWPDWTVGGAERLLEWLYTGDYGFPYPRPTSATKDGSEENGDSFDVDEELVAMDHGAKVLSKSVATSMDSTDSQNHEISTADATTQEEEAIERRLSSLQKLTWPGCRTPERGISQAEKFDRWVGHQCWKADQLDYEATLLAHAEVYVMACRYMLAELKNLSWQRLRSILMGIGNISAASPVIGNLVTLISYAYKESSNEPNCTEPLRQLVTTFAALNFTDFRGSEVDELMMSTELSDREFISDLTLLARQKMRHLERADSKSPLDHLLEPLEANAMSEAAKVVAEKREFEAGLAQLTWRAWSQFSPEDRERCRDKGRSVGVFVDRVMTRRYPILSSRQSL